LEAQNDLQRQPKEPGCSLECVITGLMFFSDATHLANFRTVKAWPLYLYFGNLSKYARSSPTSGACHLIGFLPSICHLPPVLCDLIWHFLSFQIVSRIFWVTYLAYRRPASRLCRRIVDESCSRAVGTFCSMLILFAHTVTELCSDVWMEYWDVSFRESSLIRPITQKSASFPFVFVLPWNTYHRFCYSMLASYSFSLLIVLHHDRLL
jgi:hypothetical protein